MPFHRKIRMFVGPSPLPVSPTAQARLSETAATPNRMVPPPGVGLGTRFHALPFQCRIKLMPGPHPQLMSPTAQALPVGVMATPNRKSARPGLGWGLGLGTCFHAVPFDRRIKVLAPLVPTAQALVADVAATLYRLLPAGAGLATCFHAVPFHRSASVLVVVPVLVPPTAQALVADVAATPSSRARVVTGTAAPAA